MARELRRSSEGPVRYVTVPEFSAFATTARVGPIGDYSGTLAQNSSLYRREGKNIFLYVDARQGGSGIPANTRLLAMPEVAPGVAVFGFLLDADTGAAVPAYVTADGYLQFVFSRAAGTKVLGYFPWILP